LPRSEPRATQEGIDRFSPHCGTFAGRGRHSRDTSRDQIAIIASRTAKERSHAPLPTIALAFATSVVAFAAQAADIKNIVIVHGAFADGSGWWQAGDIPARRGFNVTVVQEPLTSLAADIEAANRVLDLQDGPTLLVGHS
jgi:hypothetical protein